MIIHFDEKTTSENKILWKTSFGFKKWKYIYIITAFLLGFEYAGRPFTTGFETLILFLISLIPMFLVSSLRVKRVAKHPSVEKYKTEFEEHIRKKEEEIIEIGENIDGPK